MTTETSLPGQPKKTLPTKTILLVEDEAILALTQKTLLEAEGYHVLLAHSADQAMAIASRVDPPVDLILMDINLGAEMDGIEAARRILQKRPIPLVFLTAHTEKEVVEKAEEITAYGYVVKCSGPTVLNASIKMAFKLFEARSQVQESEQIHHTQINQLANELQVILDTVTFGISQIKNGSVIWCNAAHDAIFGYPQGGMIGLSSAVFYANPEDFARIVAEFQVPFRSGAVYHTEALMRRADGAQFWASLSGKPIDPARREAGSIWAIQDISERKRAEIEKQRSEAFLDSVLEYSPTALWISDADGTMQRMNQALRALLHITDEEVIGKYNIFHDNLVENQGFMPLVRDVYERGKQAHFMIKYDTASVDKLDLAETTRLVLDVHISPIQDAAGRVTNAIIQHSEVTALSEALAARLASETNLAAVFNVTDESIILVDAEMTIQAMNEVAAQRLNVDRGEWIGRKGMGLFPPEAVANRRPHFMQALHSGKPVEFEDQIDGRWMENHIYPIHDPHTRAWRLAIFSKDITEQKKTQEAIRTSEERFRILAERSGKMVYTISASGEILYLNELAARAVQADQAALVGQPVSALFPHGDQVRMWASIQQVFETGVTQHSEDMLHFPDGDHWVETWLTPLTDAQNKITAVMGGSRDVTERKKAEQALVESQMVLQKIIEASPVPFALNDDQGNIVYLNSAFTHIFGYDCQELKTLEDWWPRAYPDPEYRQWVAARWYEHLENSRRDEQPFEPFEVKICDRQGQTHFVMASAVPLSEDYRGDRLVILNDFTHHKQIEMDLQQQRDTARQVLELMGQGLTITDEDARFVFVNPAFARLFGYTPAQLIGKKPDDVTAAEVLPELAEQRKHRMKGENSTYESRLVRADGSLAPVLVNAVPRQVDGKYAGSIAVITDLTEQKKAEEKILRLLQEKELLLHEVHHRIKNNMNIIYGLLHLQIEGTTDPDAQKALQDSAGRVQSMMVLYDKLYRSENFNDIFLPDYLPTLLMEVIALYPHRERIQLEYEIDDISLGPNTIAPLGILLNELTTNTMKYAFPGQRAGVIRVEVRRQADRVWMVYQDNGAGFEINPKHPNQGLGTHLVPSLVRQLLGMVTVESGAQGTRYTIDFPIG